MYVRAKRGSRRLTDVSRDPFIPVVIHDERHRQRKNGEGQAKAAVAT